MSIINKGVYDAGKMFILQTGNDWPTADVVFAGYESEIHVSQLDGNDTTGNGDLINPVATITKALTLVTSGVRRTIVIHPGYYQESPSITVQSTVLNSFSPLGGTTLIDGTLSSNVGCTIAGFQITNVNITAPSGVGDIHVIDCTVTGTLTKSGSATYTEIHHTDVNTACNITGAGQVVIDNSNSNFVTVNNAGASVTVRNATSCVAPVLTAGTLNLVDSTVIAAVTNAVTTSAGTVVTITNCQMLNTALNNVAPVSLSGFYSIFNCVYDKSGSTLAAVSGTGGSTNSVDYFQFINADSIGVSGSITANTWNKLYTANVVETANNLYFTNTRVVSALVAGDYVTIEANGRISANVGTVVVQAAVQVNNLDNLTTANLAEGTNLYFTNTRARAVYTAGKGINIDTQGVIKNTGRTALYNTDINGTGGGNVLSTMSTILTLPTIPSTDRFLLRSLLVTNLSDSTSYVSGNILYATGNTAIFANQIPVATGGLVEFIKNGQLFQPGDKINLQGFNSSSTATANILNAMYTYETFDNDATYIGVGQTLATSNTNITIYNSLNGFSIVESIILVNVSASTPRIKLYWADANGTPKVYLAYNTPIPTNSSVELITTAKRLDITDVLVASYDNAGAGAVSVFVSARTGPTYAIGAYTATTEIAGNISLTFGTSELDGTLIYYTIE